MNCDADDGLCGNVLRVILRPAPRKRLVATESPTDEDVWLNSCPLEV
jgi:hypothetical protein